VTLVVSVLKTANNLRGGADQSRQLPLSEASPCTQGENLARDMVVGPRLFQSGKPLRLPFIIAAMENFYCVSSLGRRGG
jgi:hypothetical protein